jgi:HlyD family secretion protein
MPIHNISTWSDPRSEEVQEILERNPSWILRWGIGIFLLIISSLLAASGLISYPDVIGGNAMVTGRKPPVTLVAQSGGVLVELKVSNRQKVAKGTVAAIIESTAKYEDVLCLERICDTLRSRNYILQEIFSNTIFPELVLGEIQPSFENLAKACSELEVFLGSDLYGQKILALKKETSYYDEYARHTWLQSLTLLKEFELAQKKFRTDSLLELSGAIAPLQLDEARAFLLQKKYSYQSALSLLSQTKIRKAEMENSMAELQMQKEIEYRRLFDSFSSSLQSLEIALSEWKKKYLLIAPVEGTVNLFENLAPNRFLKPGEEVMTLVPDSADVIIAWVQVPVEGSAKVEKGLPVKIKLLNYPHEEYGLLTGKIESISSVPKNNFYEAEVFFPDGLKTTYGKTLPFRQQMPGSAEIITKERSVMSRLFDKFYSMVGH